MIFFYFHQPVSPLAIIIIKVHSFSGGEQMLVRAAFQHLVLLSGCSGALGGTQASYCNNTALPPQRWVVTFTFPLLCLLGPMRGEPGNLPHPVLDSTLRPLLPKALLKVSGRVLSPRKGGKASLGNATNN